MSKGRKSRKSIFGKLEVINFQLTLFGNFIDI